MRANSVEELESSAFIAAVCAEVAAPSRGPERTVSAALAHVVLMLGVKRGLSPDALCASCGFHEEDLTDRDRQVPYAWFSGLVQALGAHSPGESLTAELARFAVLEQFGYLGQALKHASTPLESLTLLVKYSRLVDSALHGREPTLERHGNTLHVVIPQPSADKPDWVAALLAGVLAAVRAVSRGEVKPREVRIARVIAGLHEELCRFFEAPISFTRADNRLVFDLALLEQPTRRADSSAQHFCAQLDKLVEQLDVPFVTLVQRTIATQLMRGDLSQERVGRCLALSQRSLQRKLSQHGLTYSGLLHETRKAVAARLLMDPELSVTDVADTLGYQDVSSFARVFKCWTGLTPRSYRVAQRNK